MMNVQIVTFGSDCAIVTLEFIRGEHHGRQSQTWWKLPEGWKVVSAHVSLYETYTEQAAALVGMPIPSKNNFAVAQNIERATRIASPVLDYELTEEIQSAPRFEP